MWTCHTERRGRLSGSTRTTRRAPHQRACAYGQASKFSAERVLQHRFVECEIGNHLLQLCVLILELLQPAHLIRQQPVILLLPVEIRRLADPGLAADLRHRNPVTALLQNERLLRVRKLRRLHRFPLLPSLRKPPENSTQKRSSFLGSDQQLSPCVVSCGKLSGSLQT